MRQIVIKENEAGQRLDKFLRKYMPYAPASFFIKCSAKKNITLNGKKAEGKEKLSAGDWVHFYLAEETIEGFRETNTMVNEYQKAYQELKGITVVYEDSGILIVNKPGDVLSQKAREGDLSVNEWMIGYLLSTGQLAFDQLATFKPAVCNRLDRNTKGLLIGSKSLAAGQYMNQLIRERQIKKYYRLFVKGKVSREELLEGYLVKDEKTNRVHLVKEASDERASYIKTRYYPIKQFSDRTLVEAELVTGKSHQIRIHMASISHPILGDYKYGDRKWNDRYKAERQIESQLLYACRLEFGKLKAPLEELSCRVITAPVPVEFEKLMDKE